MAGRNRLTGICWHEEWHAVDKKKDKAADCVYLTEDRICTNRSCIKNGEKCFVATNCRYRVREADAPAQKTTPKKRKAICSLPKGCVVFSKQYGIGEYVQFDAESRLIHVLFEDKMRKFSYPDAFVNHHLYGNDIVSECVRSDSNL